MMHKKGFTLVEMSIVLVIIGLLIGEILVGQSLIHTAKALKITTQSNELYYKFGMFYDRYKVLPGDVANGHLKGLSNSCDPNGFIGGISGSPACSGNELGNSFRDLYRSGLNDFPSTGGYHTCRYNGASPSQGIVPELKGVDSYNGSKIIFCTYNTYNSRLVNTAVTTSLYGQPPFSYLSLQNSEMPDSGSPTGWGTSGAVDARTAYYMDKKIDDGSPGLGKIRVARNRVFLSSGCVDGDYTTDANSLGWDLKTDVECIPLYVLDFNRYR